MRLKNERRFPVAIVDVNSMRLSARAIINRYLSTHKRVRELRSKTEQ
jgi:hypothetical protein